MNLLRNSLSIFFILLLAGCAINSKLNLIDKEQLLLEHLESWNEFQADGIVTVNYDNFVFRKNINIKKTSDIFKITVYDSGIFGMKPEPFLTVKIDSLIQIKTQSAEPEFFALDRFPGLQFFLKPLQLLKFKNQIIRNNILNFDENTTIRFSEEMKIKSIKQLSKEFSIDFFYETDLTGIEVWQNKIDLIKIEIDKITRKRD
ncbi:MAG: hypothetical protein Q7J16_06990 [Candidatus Cloacimonadales bacterium]|nr:hypothetical protein [Candidatus Cloacimonadales bacterium]